MIDDDGKDVKLAQGMGRRARFVEVGVAMSDVGDAMFRSQAFEQIVRSNAFAGIERVWQFLVEYGDVQTSHVTTRLAATRRLFAAERNRVVIENWFVFLRAPRFAPLRVAAKRSQSM